MAKVAFTKLGLKKKDEVKNVDFNGVTIEVKQYLPVNDKLDLISRVLNASHDQSANFANPIQLEVIGTIEIIMAYTNLSFTEKQKEDYAKLYDLFEENGIIDLIIAEIPEREYNYIIDGVNETADAVYKYQNSVMGILDTISQDYSGLDLDATNIQKKLADPENLELLKNIMTKLG